MLSDFPILHPGFHYLDSAATTLKPKVVIDAEVGYYHEYSANVHRGLYPIAEKATQAYEEARDIVAGFLGADSSEIVFTKSATHASNMLTSALEPFITKKGAIVASVAEHHSAFLPWQHVSKAKDIPFFVLPLTDDGKIDESNIKAFPIDATEHSIWMLHQISNVTGVCQDIPMLVRAVRSAFPKAIIIVDACQSVSHVPVKVVELDCDALFFSGHKIFGPTGVGVLWVRESLHEQLAIPEWGGEMVAAVVDGKAQVQKMPHRFEAGTPAIAQVIGLGAALQWFTRQDPMATKGVIEELGKELVKGISTIDSVNVLFPQAIYDSGIITCFCSSVHPHDIAAELGSKNICVRAGYQCAQPLHEYLGIGPTLRISLHLYNTLDDVHACALALQEAVTMYRR